MRFDRVLSTLAALAPVCAARAQTNAPSTFAKVEAQGGFVSGRAGNDPFAALITVAGNATVTLDNTSEEGGGGGGGGGFLMQQARKFSGPADNPAPATFSNGDSGLGGSSSTNGASTVTPGGGATNYSAGWGSRATSPSSSPTPQASTGGTYDPWTVTYASLLALPNASPGSVVDLYYQSGLLGPGSRFGGTGIGTSPSGAASYIFRTYVQETVGITTFFPLDLEVHFDSVTGLSASLSDNGEFDVFLLGANGNSPNADPSARVSARDAQKLQTGDLKSILDPLIDDTTGAPTRDLEFGIVRHYKIPARNDPNVDPNDLFEWHTDTIVATQAVPEPSAWAALGLGTLALLRRRRR